MGLRQRSHFLALGTLLALGLGACTDRITPVADRATNYNRQAEQAQEQVLLLNVVRAMQRRPMQFTSLQTITGQLTASQTGQVSFPFGHGPNDAAARMFSLSETVSGGPQFAVPVLDTQEFYRGLLQPISPQIIDLYVEARYPEEQVLDLMLHKIVFSIGEKQLGCLVKRVKASTAKNKDAILRDLYGAANDGDVAFDNYPGDSLSFALFQSMLEHLIDDHGLTTGKIDKDVSLGPALKGAKLEGQLGALARATDAKMSFEKQEDEAEDCPTAPTSEKAQTAAKPKKPDAQSDFVLVRSSTVYGFCFERNPEDEKTVLTIGELKAQHAALSRCKPDAAGGATIFALPQHVHDEILKLASLIDAYCGLNPKAPACAPETPQDSCSQLLKSLAPTRPDGGAAALAPVKGMRPMLEPPKSIGQACRRYPLRLWNQYLAMAEALYAFDPTGMSAGKAAAAIDFYPRSTESAIYYLGEVARSYRANAARLAQGEAVDFPVANENFPVVGVFKIPSPGERYAAVHCTLAADTDGCRNFFRVEEGSEIGHGPVTVEYDGTNYGIADTVCPAGKGCDYSAPTLELVKHLLALNTSAKDLPATTVLTVIGAP